MDAAWIAGIAASIICGLIGIIYLAGQNRDDKQDARFERDEESLNDHIRDDTAMHERLVRVETKVDTLKEEVEKIRDMRHEILEHTTKAISEWYISIMEHVRKLIDQVRK